MIELKKKLKTKISRGISFLSRVSLREGLFQGKTSGNFQTMINNNYIITGGKKLSGEVVVNSSKNAAVAILIASLLNEKKTVIKNVPKIEEVFRIVEVLESIGVKVEWKGHSVTITPPSKKIRIENIKTEAAAKTRSVIFLIGALIHKFKEFNIPMSGGCKLGRRTIAPHSYALENLGVKIKVLNGKLKITRDKLKPAEIVMYESGDTATENTILAASLISGKTIIKYASANYQVQDLCYFLTKLGIKIEGIGTTTLVVHGKEKISKNIEYWLTEDPIEAMFFIALAITTKSSITIKRCPIDFIDLELLKLKKMGFRFKILKKYKARNGKGNLVDIKTFPSNLIAPVEKIYGRPYPGLNIDNLPFFVPIATQAKGETLIHDWVYENRAVYFIELNRLGANITLADPHRVIVKGPTELKSAEMACPPALRPSVAILVAMLAAKGKSILKDTYMVERGYENICGRLKALGAEIREIRIGTSD
jgi:UDP-N-acetylglucosamine 1-carboxyvinyltransferase